MGQRKNAGTGEVPIRSSWGIRIQSEAFFACVGIKILKRLTYGLLFHIFISDGMRNNRQKRFNLAILFIFLFIILYTNFLHTEKTLSEDDNCPACQFQHSSLSTAQINFFCVPTLSFFHFLKSYESFNYYFIFSLIPNSRSPPNI